MVSRTEDLVARLRDLAAGAADIEAAAVVSVDGMLIASALPRGVEPDRISAMSAAMLSLSERMSVELGRGALDGVFIRGEHGYVLLQSIGGSAVLTALAGKDARLGRALLDMRRAAADLHGLL